LATRRTPLLARFDRQDRATKAAVERAAATADLNVLVGLRLIDPLDPREVHLDLVAVVGELDDGDPRLGT
jgi:hypothetical protein